ncbi:MAG TPA: hypothetical protein VHY08_03130 [Bacillota bacterium]|nr:hypothetical protein [Bacillota bacterium]
MAKKVTLVIPEEIFKHLSEVAAATEKSLSATVSTGIESLYWMRKQKEEGFVVKAEKEDKDKIIIREISLS